MIRKIKNIFIISVFVSTLFLLLGFSIDAHAEEYLKIGDTFEDMGNVYQVTKPYNGSSYGRCKLIKVSGFWNASGMHTTLIELNKTVTTQNNGVTEYYFQNEFADGLFKNNVELERISIYINHSQTYSNIPLSAEKNVIPKNCFSGCKYLQEVQITSGYSDKKYPKDAKKLTFEKNCFNKCSDTLSITFINIGAKNIKVKKGALGKSSCKRALIIDCADHMQKSLNSNKDRINIAKMFKKSGAARPIKYVYKDHDGWWYKTLK
ncbi:MAG: hypothetical protein E7302_10360 [Butyrivibrio sp.]|nr:hypothetical protein [Butyrivibrio sp.]